MFIKYAGCKSGGALELTSLYLPFAVNTRLRVERSVLTRRQKSPLAQKIRRGEVVVTTELTPTKGIDFPELDAKSEALKGVRGRHQPDGFAADARVYPATAVGRLLLDRGIGSSPLSSSPRALNTGRDLAANALKGSRA
jgi:hypothetical protein